MTTLVKIGDMYINTGSGVVASIWKQTGADASRISYSYPATDEIIPFSVMSMGELVNKLDPTFNERNLKEAFLQSSKVSMHKQSLEAIELAILTQQKMLRMLYPESELFQKGVYHDRQTEPPEPPPVQFTQSSQDIKTQTFKVYGQEITVPGASVDVAVRRLISGFAGWLHGGADAVVINGNGSATKVSHILFTIPVPYQKHERPNIITVIDPSPGPQDAPPVKPDADIVSSRDAKTVRNILRGYDRGSDT